MDQIKQPLLEVKNLTREFPAGETTVRLKQLMQILIYILQQPIKSPLEFLTIFQK